VIAVKLEMFQKIRLTNGNVGHVIEVFNDGEAYMIDIMTDDGEYEQNTVYPKDIRSVVVEVDEPFIATA
jgi:hypothetical protein